MMIISRHILNRKMKTNTILHVKELFKKILRRRIRGGPI